MRSNAAEFDLIAPPSLAETLSVLAGGEHTPLAGGTELMVALCAGRLTPGRFVSLAHLSELRFIDDSDPATLRIGAGTTFSDLRASDLIAREFPLLVQTASWTGSIANQNRGTIGGNIANASPAADNPPALLAYDAELELMHAAGTRTLAYRDFHLGYKRTALQPGELIAAVRLPRRFIRHVQWVRKVGTRNAQAISKVALAGTLRMDRGVCAEVRLAAASLMDRPSRLLRVEEALQGKPLTDAVVRAAETALRAEAAPIDDIRSTARYRVQVAVNLLKEFLQQCAEKSVAN